MSRPLAEVDPDATTVSALLKEQRPDLAGLTIQLVDEGWDNFTFRIGQKYAARLPRRQVAVPLLANEQQWLPLLATRLSVEVPLPVHLGSANAAFSWPWSVVKWVPGHTAESHLFETADAVLLAKALKELHQPTPHDAPVNPYRGVPLSMKSEIVEARLSRIQQLEVDSSRLAAIWRDGCDADRAQVRVWVHGDLHPRNVVIRDGSLVGIIDWGDLNGGDEATDIACAWMLMADARCRLQFFEAYGAGKALQCRAKGWAVHMSLAHIESGEPRHVRIGKATLHRVLADS